MKYYLLIFAILSIFCGQVFAQVTVPTKRSDDSLIPFDKVYKILTDKPKWLFEDFVCPLEIFPAVETKLNYSLANCAENPEDCLNECKNKDGNNCYALALLVQDKKGIDQDYSEALFLRSCQLGIISGCTNRAARIFDSNVEKDVICAAKTFEKTCDKNDPWGCTMFGVALALGAGIEENIERALQVFPKACQYREDHESCKAAKDWMKKIEESKKNRKK